MKRAVRAVLAGALILGVLVLGFRAYYRRAVGRMINDVLEG